MNIVIDSTTKQVLMYSLTGKPSAGPGQAAYSLDQAHGDTVLHLIETSPGGVVYDPATGDAHAMPPPPGPVLPSQAAEGLIERRARAQDRKGTVEGQIEAIKLRTGV